MTQETLTWFCKGTPHSVSADRFAIRSLFNSLIQDKDVSSACVWDNVECLLTYDCRPVVEHTKERV